MPLLQVTNHQSNSIVQKNWNTILKSWLPWHSPPADFTMEWEIVPHDGTNQQNFAVLPLKLNGQIRTWVYYDRIPSDSAIFRHESPVEFAGWAFRNMTLHIIGDKRPVNLHLDARRNPRTASFIRTEQAAPTPPIGKTEENDQASSTVGPLATGQGVWTRLNLLGPDRTQIGSSLTPPEHSCVACTALGARTSPACRNSHVPLAQIRLGWSRATAGPSQARTNHTIVVWPRTRTTMHRHRKGAAHGTILDRAPDIMSSARLTDPDRSNGPRRPSRPRASPSPTASLPPCHPPCASAVANPHRTEPPTTTPPRALRQNGKTGAATATSAGGGSFQGICGQGGRLPRVSGTSGVARAGATREGFMFLFQKQI
jgi:hypothetical protein